MEGDARDDGRRQDDQRRRDGGGADVVDRDASHVDVAFVDAEEQRGDGLPGRHERIDGGGTYARVGRVIDQPLDSRPGIACVGRVRVSVVTFITVISS